MKYFCVLAFMLITCAYSHADGFWDCAKRDVSFWAVVETAKPVAAVKKKVEAQPEIKQPVASTRPARPVGEGWQYNEQEGVWWRYAQPQTIRYQPQQMYYQPQPMMYGGFGGGGNC